MLKEIGSIFSFLTIIPSPHASLESVARFMHVFPIVGIAIGVIIGAFGLGLSEAGIDPLIAGLLIVAFTAIITGLHHTDGLADFADGMMAKGTREKKISAMRDAATGSSGVAAIVLYYMGMLIALSLASGTGLFMGILLAEIVAKFSMVLMASVGKSATAGTSSPFVSLMRDRRKLVFAVAASLAPLLVLGGITGAVMFCTGVAITLLLVALSSRSFGGITGDVLGAANELSRLASIMVFVSI